MKRPLLIIGAIACTVTLLGLLIRTSRFEIPPSASNMKLIDRSGWQYRKFVPRFDDSPESCRAFAISLMKRHLGNDTEIAEEPFTRFPVSLSGFPNWFDVDHSVKHGTLITGDNWIYAVVDDERGRLYYYYSH